MDSDSKMQEDADATNEHMVAQMELRRQARPERRVFPSTPVANERRRSCAYCHQPGDHPTPSPCLRARALMALTRAGFLLCSG